MAACEVLGAFALTEPSHGSDVVALETRAHRDGNEWVLDGEKRWIGNGTVAGIVVVWARDDNGNVGAFVVEHPDGADHPVPGYHARKIVGKAANRGVWQAQIKLDGVRVPAGARLAKANSWDDTNLVLAKSRQTVAWEALGHAIAAYEAALTYSLRREQFGRPLARFQLIQDKLSHMLSDITGMQLICTRMSQLQPQGRVSIEHAALAKLNTGDAPAGSAPWPGTSWAATGSCSITTSPGITPTSRRSTPTRAPTPSSRSSSVAPSRGSTPSADPPVIRADRPHPRTHQPHRPEGAPTMSVPVTNHPTRVHHEELFADLNDPTAGRVAQAREMASAQTAMIADPAPLGLAAFALTTFLLSLVNAGVMPKDTQPVMLGVALAFGGVAQLLAGMWEFRKGNVFGATVFSAYGAFWLSFWAYLTFYAEGIPAEHHGVAAGWYLIAWAIFTTLMLVAALRTTAVLATLFAVVAVVFVLLAFGAFGSDPRSPPWAESAVWSPPGWPGTCAWPRSAPPRSAGRSCRTRRCSAAEASATPGASHGRRAAAWQDSGSGSDQPSLGRPDHRLQPGIDAQLVQKRCDITLHGGFGDEQPARDLLVGATLGQQIEHLPLPGRQHELLRLPPQRAHHVDGQRLGNPRVDLSGAGGQMPQPHRPDRPVRRPSAAPRPHRPPGIAGSSPFPQRRSG